MRWQHPMKQCVSPAKKRTEGTVNGNTLRTVCHTMSGCELATCGPLGPVPLSSPLLIAGLQVLCLCFPLLLPGEQTSLQAVCSRLAWQQPHASQKPVCVPGLMLGHGTLQPPSSSMSDGTAVAVAWIRTVLSCAVPCLYKACVSFRESP